MSLQSKVPRLETIQLLLFSGNGEEKCLKLPYYVDVTLSIKTSFFLEGSLMGKKRWVDGEDME